MVHCQFNSTDSKPGVFIIFTQLCCEIHLAQGFCVISISARISWVTTITIGRFFIIFLQQQQYFALLHLVLHAHDNDARVSKKGVLLLLDGVDDFIADAGVQFLFLQLSPL